MDSPIHIDSSDSAISAVSSVSADSVDSSTAPSAPFPSVSPPSPPSPSPSTSSLSAVSSESAEKFDFSFPPLPPLPSLSLPLFVSPQIPLALSLTPNDFSPLPNWSPSVCFPSSPPLDPQDISLLSSLSALFHWNPQRLNAEKILFESQSTQNRAIRREKYKKILGKKERQRERESPTEKENNEKTIKSQTVTKNKVTSLPKGKAKDKGESSQSPPPNPSKIAQKRRPKTKNPSPPSSSLSPLLSSEHSITKLSSSSMSISSLPLIAEADGEEGKRDSPEVLSVVEFSPDESKSVEITGNSDVSKNPFEISSVSMEIPSAESLPPPPQEISVESSSIPSVSLSPSPVPFTVPLIPPVPLSVPVSLTAPLIERDFPLISLPSDLTEGEEIAALEMSTSVRSHSSRRLSAERDAEGEGEAEGDADGDVDADGREIIAPLDIEKDAEGDVSADTHEVLIEIPESAITPKAQAKPTGILKSAMKSSKSSGFSKSFGVVSSPAVSFSPALSTDESAFLEAEIQTVKSKHSALHAICLQKAAQGLPSKCSVEEEELLRLLALLRRKHSFHSQRKRPRKAIRIAAETTTKLSHTQSSFELSSHPLSSTSPSLGKSSNSSDANSTKGGTLAELHEETDDDMTDDDFQSVFDVERDIHELSVKSGVWGRQTNTLTDVPQEAKERYSSPQRTFWAKRTLVVSAQWFHVAALAMGSILSATYFSWNEGLAAGFGSFAVASLLSTVAYLILTYSLAEMASALPFSGGSYGFTRACMGTFPGMFVGLCESLEYILTTAVNTIILSRLVTQCLGTSPSMEPLWGLISYSVSLFFHVRGGRLMWNFLLAITALDVMILVIYWLGAIPFASFASNVPNPPLSADLTDSSSASSYFWGGPSAFLNVLPLSLWWFVGIEAMPLLCEETEKPRENVPKGMRWGMIIVIIISAITLLVGCSLPNSSHKEFVTSEFPLIFGFETIFNTNSSLISLLMLPGIYASAFSFVFAYGRQIYALSRSGLLPKFLSLTNEHGTPAVAMIVGSAIGYFVCILRLIADDRLYQTQVYNCMLIVAIVNYIFQLVCFAILRVNYPMLSRSFHSPFGLVGAALSCGFFIFSLIALLGWTPNIQWAVLSVSLYLILGMAYYVFISSHHLILSPEESFALFMVYSVNAIRAQRKRKEKEGGEEGVGVGGSSIKGKEIPSPNHKHLVQYKGRANGIPKAF